ncbi:hypothetical protein NDU88_003198 [Pleurodeles waltl]|uniref:Uncharacterized protein n=1 Tax=Pleurodeles waltl TaxID=8319 RepID=A0AAV7MRK3_PLEWA|nr:hypothetical protein NDU88_003198 [Pleurodeles waltl]
MPAPHVAVDTVLAMALSTKQWCTAWERKSTDCRIHFLVDRSPEDKVNAGDAIGISSAGTTVIGVYNLQEDP